MPGAVRMAVAASPTGRIARRHGCCHAPSPGSALCVTVQVTSAPSAPRAAKNPATASGTAVNPPKAAVPSAAVPVHRPALARDPERASVSAAAIRSAQTRSTVFWETQSAAPSAADHASVRPTVAGPPTITTRAASQRTVHRLSVRNSVDLRRKS